MIEKLSENPNFENIKDEKLKEGIRVLNLNKTPVCYAPIGNMMFDPTGRVSACCVTRYRDEFGVYPEKSLKEIWFNNKRRLQMIEDLNEYKFPSICTHCINQIKIQNPHAFLLSFNEHTVPYDKDGYPTRMNFEFSTVCNYECIMCGGAWSSSIRKNREKLPPLTTPFHGKKFLEEIKEFIPHLKFATFLGGEPFLAKIYYQMWEIFAQLNKNAEIITTSNCSIYNNRVQKVFDSLPNFKINASVDSLNKETYEIIRKNGKFENFYDNLMTFIEQKRISFISCCVLIQNIYEAPKLVEFCTKHGIGLSFTPVSSALGGNIKGIHKNGKAEGAYNGTSVEAVNELPAEKQIPEFRPATLPVSELEKMVKMATELEESCNNYLKPSCTSLKNQLKSHLENKRREENI